jgi:AcrR family transcriptional regulator
MVLHVKGSDAASEHSSRALTLRVIESAAFGLFVDKRFGDVTAEEIANAAGISVRTFYRYFPEGKEGVVLRRARAAVQDLVDALKRRPPQESAPVALREAVLNVAREWNSSEPTLSQPAIEISSNLYSQIAMQDSALLARLIGERILLLEPIVEQLALRLAVDPTVDVRPRLMAHAANSAVTAAWFATQIDPSLDWLDLIGASLEVLGTGFESGCRRVASEAETAHVA